MRILAQKKKRPSASEGHANSKKKDREERNACSHITCIWRAAKGQARISWSASDTDNTLNQERTDKVKVAILKDYRHEQRAPVT